MTIILWILFVWVSYHLVREVLQDGFGLQSKWITLGHRLHRRPLHLGSIFAKFWGLLFEIPLIVLCVVALVTDPSGLAGGLAVGTFLAYVAFWIFTVA